MNLQGKAGTDRDRQHPVLCLHERLEPPDPHPVVARSAVLYPGLRGQRSPAGTDDASDDLRQGIDLPFGISSPERKARLARSLLPHCNNAEEDGSNAVLSAH